MSNDEITRLIGKIRERYDRVHESSGSIVRIEVDMLQADIRELYEKISTLTHTSPDVDIPQPQFPEPEIVEEEGPVMVTPFSETESAPEQAIEVHPSKAVDEGTIFPESLIETDAMEIDAPSPVIPDPKPEIYTPESIPDAISEYETQKEIVPPVLPQPSASQPIREPAPAPAVHVHESTTPVHPTLDLFGALTTTLADKFRDEKRSVSEKLHHETSADKSIGSRLRLKITDLRSAIGINDRFIFINELFEGDMRMYDDMLNRLNSCSSLHEANMVFNNAKDVQGWSDELNSVERLLEFIHRRYA